MTVLALALFAVLGAIAALHAYWALGGLWPGTDVQQLADTVIGDAKRRAMPPTALTLLVAALIFAAGALPLVHLNGPPFGLPDWLTRAGLWALVLVFIGRGIVTYILRTQAAAMTEPFATLTGAIIHRFAWHWRWRFWRCWRVPDPGCCTCPRAVETILAQPLGHIHIPLTNCRYRQA